LFFFPTLKSSTELGFAVFSRYWKQVEVRALMLAVYVCLVLHLWFFNGHARQKL